VREKEREKDHFQSERAHDTHVVRQYVDRSANKIRSREQGPFDSCASHYREEDGRESGSDLWQLLVRQIQYV
jgi:hypothetical protein